MILHLCTYIYVHVTRKTQLMSYVQPFWRVDQASSGFWQASRSLLSFFWSPLHFLRITICQILVKNWKKHISGCLSLNHLGQNWKEVSFKTRKTSANFGWTSMVSSDWSSYQTPLPVKIRCWIDLSQRQAKAQVQMPFHSKPAISCALDLTFFEVVTKPWWFFSQQKGHFWKGIFGCLVSSTWGEKKTFKKNKKMPLQVEYNWVKLSFTWYFELCAPSTEVGGSSVSSSVERAGLQMWKCSYTRVKLEPHPK